MATYVEFINNENDDELIDCEYISKWVRMRERERKKLMKNSVDQSICLNSCRIDDDD